MTLDDAVAIMTIQNPPVNALSPGVPEGISAAIEQIAKDDNVKAAVVIGGGRTFVAAWAPLGANTPSGRVGQTKAAVRRFQARAACNGLSACPPHGEYV